MASSQQILYPADYLCECADNYIVCKAEEHIRWSRFKVGKKVDIRSISKIEKLRRILCSPVNNLCEDEIAMLSEELNKLVS